MSSIAVVVDDETKLELLKTLEYYFSTKNLGKDAYLVSQMDAETYVSLYEIAKFPKIKQLTHDLELIKAIIRQSTQLVLDPITNAKVRSINGLSGGLITVKTIKNLDQLTSNKVVTIPTNPYAAGILINTKNTNNNISTSNNSEIDGSGVFSNNSGGKSLSSPSMTTTTTTASPCQKCILILREVCSEATLEQVKDLFTNKEPSCPTFLQCESAGNDSWYVTFTNEEQAQRALQYLKTEVQTFMEKPIRARIKHVVSVF